MHGAECFHPHVWWSFPLFMVVMIVMFLFMMRGRRGGWMCGFDRNHWWRRSSAFRILERRYAGGEIDRAEYEKMKKVLEGEELNPAD